jgi:hypothetical protein
MYAGHAAIALIIKSRRPDVPMLPLALACYGPDFIDISLMIPHTRAGMGPYSHSIPAVLIGAAAAAICFAMTAGRPGAMAIFIGWLVHWPADVLTGIKPIINLHAVVGLDLYHLPPADAILEVVLILAAGWVYAQARVRERRQMRVVVVMAAVLIVLQVSFDFAIPVLDSSPWRPTFILASV